MDKDMLKEKIGETPVVRPVPDMKDVPVGHPAKTMAMENEALSGIISKLETGFSAEDFKKLLELDKHYGKKEKLFMAVLYHKGVTGPSGGMWDVDDEIMKELHSIVKEFENSSMDSLKIRVEPVLIRIKQMIRSETEGFLPTSFRFFTDEDWLQIYRDSFEIGSAFIEKLPIWEEGEAYKNSRAKEEGFLDGNLVLETGKLSFSELKADMKLLPVDITFIDKDEVTRFFLNEHKVFGRAGLITDKSVYGCHPTRIFAAIETMIKDFKAKKRTSSKSIQMIHGRPISIDYIAVYDEKGEYMGTVELVEDHSRAFEFFKKTL